MKNIFQDLSNPNTEGNLLADFMDEKDLHNCLIASREAFAAKYRSLFKNPKFNNFFSTISNRYVAGFSTTHAMSIVLTNARNARNLAQFELAINYMSNLLANLDQHFIPNNHNRADYDAIENQINTQISNTHIIAAKKELKLTKELLNYLKSVNNSTITDNLEKTSKIANELVGNVLCNGELFFKKIISRQDKRVAHMIENDWRHLKARCIGPNRSFDFTDFLNILELFDGNAYAYHISAYLLLSNEPFLIHLIGRSHEKDETKNHKKIAQSKENMQAFQNILNKFPIEAGDNEDYYVYRSLILQKLIQIFNHTNEALSLVALEKFVGDIQSLNLANPESIVLRMLEILARHTDLFIAGHATRLLPDSVQHFFRHRQRGFTLHDLLDALTLHDTRRADRQVDQLFYDIHEQPCRDEFIKALNNLLDIKRDHTWSSIFHGRRPNNA